MKYVSPEYLKSDPAPPHPGNPESNAREDKLPAFSTNTRFGDAAFTGFPQGVSFSDPSGIQTGVNDITESYASWEQNLLAAHRKTEVSK